MLILVGIVCVNAITNEPIYRSYLLPTVNTECTSEYEPNLARSQLLVRCSRLGKTCFCMYRPPLLICGNIFKK